MLDLKLAPVLTAVILILAHACAADFYVSPRGGDRNPGTQSKPFASLTRARDAIRQLKSESGLPEGGVTVWLSGGVYPIDTTIELGEQDSGAAGAPITYRAVKGEEVRLTGGKQITGFKPVTDPTVLSRLDETAGRHVLQVDLGAQGVTDFGEITNRGFSRPIAPAALELFFDGKPMQLARWPNDEWAIISGVPEGQQGGKFNYDGDHPTRWSNIEDIRLHGYWTWAWADSYERVKSIDTQKREITTVAPHGVYGYSVGKRFYAFNILEELDQPGEWYLERKTGILYFWPPSDIEKAEVVVSLLEQPMVSLTNVSYVILRGLVMENTRGKAVEIKDGNDCLVAGCDFRNIGTVAVDINGGFRNGVLSCDITLTGEGAVVLNGGDRKTLTPAGNFVEDCRIEDFSRWVRTYRPAVHILGVGNRVAHCLIQDSPHSAIILHGNDHITEFNEISRVCMETGDAGAFYIGRDWSERGNVVRYNYFHDLGGYEDKFSAHGFSETMAVYLDDWTSGTRVFGNIFSKANRAMMIGGGRDNVVHNNIFIDCHPSVHVDARGLGWAKNYFDGATTTLFDRLKAVNHDQPPYSTRYPMLANILEDEPAVPKRNSIARNIIIGDKDWLAILDADKFDQGVLNIKDNITGEDCLVNPGNGDFSLKPDCTALKIGFKPIPVEHIGLYEDDYRNP